MVRVIIQGSFKARHRESSSNSTQNWAPNPQPNRANHRAKFFLPVRNKKNVFIAHLSANSLCEVVKAVLSLERFLSFIYAVSPLIFCPILCPHLHICGWLLSQNSNYYWEQNVCSCMQKPTFWRLHWLHLEYEQTLVSDTSKASSDVTFFYLKSKKKTCSQMEVYTVTVATGTAEYSGTNNYIYLTLLGEHGESERTLLDNPGLDFCRGAVRFIKHNMSCWLFSEWWGLPPCLRLWQVDEYKVTSPSPLGSVFVVRLEKQKYWVEDNWFCRYVKVEPPGGDSELIFPCYRWLIGDAKVEIREGTGKECLLIWNADAEGFAAPTVGRRWYCLYQIWTHVHALILCTSKAH